MSRNAILSEETRHPTAARDPASPQESGPAKGRRRLRLGLLVVLLAGLGAFFALGGHRALSFETLSEHHAAIAAWVEGHAILAVTVFALAYVLVVAFSVPGAVWMSIAGGYLFGTVAATALVVASATVGATAVFLVARYIVGEAWKARVGGTLARLEQGFRENAFSSLLVLRLVPLFPFWLVNLVPAFLGVPTRVYVIATAVGIVPGALVYTGVGNGLDAVFADGGMPDLGIIYDPEILLPLLGLAALALVPTAYRLWKGRRP
jgi:uncharacterized membrane protein YdjX (TVP38/TMEM64 family)